MRQRRSFLVIVLLYGPYEIPIFSRLIFIEKQAYSSLIDKLTTTTDGFIKAYSPKLTGRATFSQPAIPPIAPALLAWSAAQRVNRDIIIQASIEYVLSSSSVKVIASSHFPGLGEVVSNVCPITASIPTSSLAYAGYWRSLGSSQDFTDQILGSCVNVIHEDIINVWNFDDRERVSRSFISSVSFTEGNQYLLGGEFRSMMTNLVGDMAGTSDVS